MEDLRYWLNFSFWDEPPEDLKEAFLSLGIDDISRFISVLAVQLAHTSTYDKIYPGWAKKHPEKHPSPVNEIWEWMKSGEGIYPYHRDPEKCGIYRGKDLKVRERVPSQCMQIASFVGSGLKTLGIPVRYRTGFIKFTKTHETERGYKYGSHYVLEYYDRNEWVLCDPQKPKRKKRFRYSWQLVDGLKNGKIRPDEVRSFLSVDYGEYAVVKQLLRDVLALSGDIITPWKVDVLYKGRLTDKEIVGDYDRIVNELYDVVKNPDPERLQRIRNENVVSYRMK